MCVHKLNNISKEIFKIVEKRVWSRVKLEQDVIPELFKDIPDSLLYASVDPFSGISYSDSRINSANLIGDIDVF